MKRASLLLACFLFAGASFATADPVYDFTLTGEGYTLQFSSGNPPAAVEYPLGATDVGASDPAGSVDGMGGYSIGAVFVAYGSFYPNLTINVTPLPPGFPPPSATQLGEFSLSGPDVLTLVSDVPNPTPCSIFCPNDLLTFSFVPGAYTFSGEGPSGAYGNFTLNLTEEAGTAVSPEPNTWILLLSGGAGLVWVLWRRTRVRVN